MAQQALLLKHLQRWIKGLGARTRAFLRAPIQPVAQPDLIQAIRCIARWEHST